jgi:hypothetical protein
MSTNKKNNVVINNRLKQFEKEKTNPPTGRPTKVPKNTFLNKERRLYSKMETSPMAQRQYFHDSAASAMTVPEIVDRFNEQIELNEMVLAQEAEEKAARRERYLHSRKKNRKNTKAKKALLVKKEQQQQRQQEAENNNIYPYKTSHHYSLVKTTLPGRNNGVVLMNATPSFFVDPRTYQPPNHLPQPTEPETQLLLQALTDNVLLREKRTSNEHNKNNSDSSDFIITTTTQELKDALIKAFETVLIKKGQTVEEAVEQAGRKHLDNNCLYVIESGQIDLKDGATGKHVATATAGYVIRRLLKKPLCSGSSH